jgi:secondary thiamine-phosphate synthase enzyme
VSQLRVNFKEILISTGKRKELREITAEAAKAVSESPVSNGICVIYSTHTTSAIVVNENEGGLTQDILKKVVEDYPSGRGWQHDRIDDNADAHLGGTFIGPSVTIPIRDGALVLGTWQSIFFLELDGPRQSRKVIIEIMGE